MNHDPAYETYQTVCSVCLTAEVDEDTEGYVGVCLPCTRQLDEQEEKRLRPGCGCDFSFQLPRLCQPCAVAEDDAVDRAEARALEREQRRLEAM